MDRSRAAYFNEAEQMAIKEGYENLKPIMTAKSNTFAANKAREECWQKIADCVNSKQEGPAPPNFTVSEELALSNNEGRPIMEGIEGGVSSDPGAGSSQQHLFVLVDGETMVLPELPAQILTDPHTEDCACD